MDIYSFSHIPIYSSDNHEATACTNSLWPLFTRKHHHVDSYRITIITIFRDNIWSNYLLKKEAKNEQQCFWTREVSYKELSEEQHRDMFIHRTLSNVDWNHQPTHEQISCQNILHGMNNKKKLIKKKFLKKRKKRNRHALSFTHGAETLQYSTFLSDCRNPEITSHTHTQFTVSYSFLFNFFCPLYLFISFFPSS